MFIRTILILNLSTHYTSISNEQGNMNRKPGFNLCHLI